jgi:hypothetical protein
MTVGKSSARNRSSVTCLDHDHRERENIRFLAMCPPVQNLWCSPSRGVTMLMRDTLYGVQVSSDRSEAKVRETCMTGVVHKDVWLDVCQCGGKIRSRTTTYPLEASVNDIVGVEVAEALSNVG